MNEVDVVNLRQVVDNYNKLIDKYQNYYLNLYNEIKNSRLYWIDPHALRFYQAKDLEKHKIDVSYEELVNLKDLYSYIVNKYSNLGNYISFNLNNRDSLLSKFNNYINTLSNILSNYNRLDYSFASSDIQYQINAQKNNLNRMINLAKDSQNKIKNTCAKIKEIEDKISSMVNSFDVRVLPYGSTEGFI